MITNFECRTFFIIFVIKVNIHVWLYTNRFHFHCSMICLVVFIHCIILLIFSYIKVMFLQILFFKVVINLSATIDFPSLYIPFLYYIYCITCITFLLIFFLAMISLIYCEIHCLYLLIFCLVSN